MKGRYEGRWGIPFCCQVHIHLRGRLEESSEGLHEMRGGRGGKRVS